MSMSFIRKAFAIVLICFSANTLADDSYTLLNPPHPTNSGRKIEVLEFFYYGCSHCFHLHPYLNKWRETMPKDVQLEFVPVYFSNPAQEAMAYTFYALKQMNQLKLMDDKLYNAWNVDNTALVELDTIADFVAKNGVNRGDFISYYRSFSVNSDVKRCKQMTVDYQIGGTPSLIVDGKYLVTNEFKPEDTIRNLNAAISKARQERGKR